VTGWFQADQEMNMVVDSTHAFCNAAQIAEDSAEIGMETFLPFKADKGLAFLGAENQMVMQTQMG
jgi:hypothetical protein